MKRRNLAALALTDAGNRNNPVIFPPAAILAHCEYSRYQGQTIQSAYEAAMTRVRAG